MAIKKRIFKKCIEKFVKSFSFFPKYIRGKEFVRLVLIICFCASFVSRVVVYFRIYILVKPFKNVIVFNRLGLKFW